MPMPAIAKKGFGIAMSLWMGFLSLGLAGSHLASANESETLVQQELDLDATRALLQKGLNLHEIDRELKRLAAKKDDIQNRIASIEETLVLQTEAAAERKEHAGRILRSYYMGQRDALYLSVLKMDSLAEILAALEYLQIIFRHDRHMLSAYRESLKSLEAGRDELLRAQAELGELEQALLARRKEQIRLAEELEQELAMLPASAEVVNEIERLTETWEREGLPLFEEYFSSLARTMQELPEIIATDEKHLAIEGSYFVFRLSDEDLNAFLRSKDEKFNNLTFRFEDGKITAEGTDSGTRITLSGKYALEDEPENRIRFHVESVTFNGFSLPESTAKALEEQFDLSIYPEKFQLQVEAAALRMQDNVLGIYLKTKENWFDAIFGGWRS